MSRRSISLMIFSVFALLMSQPFFSGPKAISQERHKATAQLVLVDMIATDDSGRFARGLTKEDFEVTEDGKPMAIRSLDLFDFRSPSPGTSSPDETLPQGRKPRLVVIFDSMNTIQRLLNHSKSLIIDRLLECLGRGYEIMVFELMNRGGMRILQPFTSDSQLVRRAVDTATGSMWVEHATDVLVLPKELAGGERNADGFMLRTARQEFEFEEAQRLQASTTAFLSALNVIKDIPGRKPVLLVSGGFPYLNLSEVVVAKIDDPFHILKKGRRFTGEEMFTDLKTFANSHHISFYCLYADSFLRYVFPDISLDNFLLAGNITEIKKSEVSNLGDLAKSTGGLAMLGGDQFLDLEKVIQADLSSYYELSYVPPRKSADGQYHRIKVRTRRPDITLRHRPGYYDYNDDQRESLLFASAAYNPSLFQTVTFSARAIPVAVGRGRFVLWMMMTLPVPTVLQATEDGEKGIVKAGLNLVGDDNVLELSARLNFPLRLSPEFRRRLAQARHFGFSACSEEMEFKRDHYRAVIVMYDGESRTVSAVESPLRIPDLSDGGGTILQSVFGQAVEAPDTSLKDFSFSSDGALEFLRYKFHPLGVNDFSARDPVMLFLQVGEAKDDQTGTLSFAASRENRLPQAIQAQEIARSRNKKAKVWNVVYKLDFGVLSPGDYTLQIRGTVRAESPGAALSQIPFRLF